MRPYEFETFRDAIEQASCQLRYRSKIVHSDHWQGLDIRDKPEMATHEVAHVSFAVNMGAMKVPSTAIGGTIGTLQEDIEPNLPWADDHFEERVCGMPINPGVEWKRWPYGNSAVKFLDERGMFNHNYMERYWPKHAGHLVVPTLTAEDWEPGSMLIHDPMPINHGIMYDYGDLNDVVTLLAGDPFTRQAYLPVWFPEDTGGGSKRAPCTIGYHFLMRQGLLDINYHIRSCDFVRHFRDDIYLTVRLLLWVLNRCRQIDSKWDDVRPGKFVMQIGSLHLFRNDYNQLGWGR